MADSGGTLATIGRALARLVEPLRERVVGEDLRELLAELGLSFPTSADASGPLSSAGTAAVQRLTGLPAVVEALATAIDNDDTGSIIAKSLELANGVVGTITDIEKLADAIKCLAGTGIPAPELNAFAADLPRRLIDYLIVRNFEVLPGVAEGLTSWVSSSGPRLPPLTRPTRGSCAGHSTSTSSRTSCRIPPRGSGPCTSGAIPDSTAPPCSTRVVAAGPGRCSVDARHHRAGPGARRAHLRGQPQAR